MSNIKKTLFLSNKQDPSQKGMATLTFERKNLSIFATLKTFNIDTKNKYILGIKNKDKIHKQNIIFDNNKYNFMLSDFDIENDLGCVLLITDNNNFIPVIWGSDKPSNYKSSIINSLRNSIEKLKTNEVKNEQKKLVTDALNITLDSTSNKYKLGDENNNKIIDNYKNIYSAHSNYNNLPKEEIRYSQIAINEELITPYHNEIAVATTYDLYESNEDEIQEIIDRELEKNSDHTFYNMIAEQLDELFNKYPRCIELEKLIDNSKWVKIDNSDNKYYVVGIIYKSNDIKYICYGVPGNYNTEPPLEMKAYSQWLPTDIKNPYDNGFWVMYQDADTGENIIIN